jgi:hypothetical protein
MRPPRERPASVTVFAILSIIFGIWGVLGMIWSIIVFSGAIPALNKDNFALEIFQKNRVYMAFMVVSMILGSIAAIVLIVCGAALMKLRDWARRILIGYGIYAIGAGILGTVMNWIFVFKPMMAQFEGAKGPEKYGAIGGMIGGMVGGVIGLIFPALLIVFMMRREAIEACRPVPDEPPTS